MDSSLNRLESFDHELLLIINGWSGNSFLDQLMLAISMKLIWVPLYALLLYLLWREFGWSAIPYLLLSVSVLVVFADQGSVQFFKEIFQRYRPCHNILLQEKLNLLGKNCGGQYGFISSHASNVFGVSTFIVAISRFKTMSLLFFWASSVSLSRVYLGVHYPSDVITGALFGAIVGLATAFVFKKTITR